MYVFVFCEKWRNKIMNSFGQNRYIAVIIYCVWIVGLSLAFEMLYVEYSKIFDKLDIIIFPMNELCTTFTKVIIFPTARNLLKQT